MIENKIFSYCTVQGPVTYTGGTDVQTGIRLEKLKEMYLLEYFRLYWG